MVKQKVFLLSTYDFRPVALTSLVCKQLERLVCNNLSRSLSDRLDPLQFAYKAKRGVADATAILLDSCCHHLKNIFAPPLMCIYMFLDVQSCVHTQK